ncbi:MAG: flagellar filament capping protein FliD, partial [Patescibacteria group bacterium]|nr:flagellar filament capping protein FliD [Patescibacteria group bacterium]
AGNLIIADADATNTATKLQIAADVAKSSVNSGDLHLQVISRNTPLSSLNGGKGVAASQFMVADSTGSGAAVAIRVGLTDTVGDVIDAINRLHLAVKAEINATGDGILLRDTAGGSSTIKVTELGSTTAADLGLLGWGKLVDVEGESQQQINGSTTRTITISASDKLGDVQAAINGLKAGFSVSTISDGSVRPYRLMLASDQAGQAGALVIDTSQANFSFSVTAEAQDALLAYGAAANTASAVLVTSRDNTFSNLVNGMTLKIGEATGTTVSVTVSTSYATVKAAAQNLVENYNKYREYLSEMTAYNSSTNERALLHGDVTILRMENQLTRLVTSSFNVGGSYSMLQQVGIEFEEAGTLTFSESVFNAALESDPKSLEQLFATAETGATARFTTLIEQLAGMENSLLSRRLDALDDRITDDEARIERMDASLEVERERLLTSFYNMELAVSRIQSNAKSLDSIAWISDQYRAKSG